MRKINQVIAVEKGIKHRSNAALSSLYKTTQRADLFSGLTKTYVKRDEDGEELPSEHKRVQVTADEVISNFRESLQELMNVVAAKDYSNCLAKADVVIDGDTILESVPVTYLLFLEKQCNLAKSLIVNLPVLDETEEWTEDANSGLFKSAPISTHRTKKTAKPIVLYDATPEHPAQTNLITEDVIAGYWTTIKQSGALSQKKKDMLSSKVDILLDAVKVAREEANNSDAVATPNIGEKIFNYLLN